MGTYYNFAVVHDRVLIWWTDNAGLLPDDLKPAAGEPDHA